MGSPTTFDEAFLRHALDVARRAARAGGDTALRHFRDPALRIETKADGSLVSRADRDAEASVREVLATDAELGACDVLGEEHGASGTATDLRWIVDPIDGTFLFVNGVPLWGTLVALEDTRDGRPLVGVVHIPAIDNCYSAARGLGATRDGLAIRAEAFIDPERAIVHVPDERVFLRRGLGAALTTLRAGFPRLRGYCDCFGHAMVAEGAYAAAIDFALAPWDIAASIVVVEEAGGTVLTRPAGEPDRRDALLGTTAVVERIAPILGF